MPRRRTTAAVSTIAVTSNPGADNTYATLDVITVTVTFSEAVAVAGTPQITLDIGGTEQTVDYSGAGTATGRLLFRYEVQPADQDYDGIAVVENSLSLNGAAYAAGEHFEVRIFLNGPVRVLTTPLTVPLHFGDGAQHRREAGRVTVRGRLVIAGNDSQSVSINGSKAAYSRLEDNYIGTNESASSLGNGGFGVHQSSMWTYALVEADLGRYRHHRATYWIPHDSDRMTTAETSVAGAFTTSHYAVLDKSVHTPPGPQQRAPLTSQNGAPTFPNVPDGETLTRNIDENKTGDVGEPVTATDPDGDTLTYAITGDDATPFSVNTSTGQIMAKTSFDYETKSEYLLTMSVHDNQDSDGEQSTAIDDTIQVRVLVNNVDEDGTLTFLPPEQPRVGTVMTTILTDPDGKLYVASEPQMRWVWERSADRISWQAITDHGKQQNPGGSLTNRSAGASYIVTEDDKDKYLRVTVTDYRDGHSGGKTAQAVTQTQVGEGLPAPALTVVPLVTGLTVPTDLAFTPDGAMLFVERPGKLQVRFSDGTVQTVTTDQDDLHTEGWWGVLAIALDPAVRIEPPVLYLSVQL